MPCWCSTAPAGTAARIWRSRTNLSRLTLPPYAPEINPVETVWEYLRGNRLSNTVFDRYPDIVETCCDAWNFFIDDPATVVSTTSRHWAKVSL